MHQRYFRSSYLVSLLFLGASLIFCTLSVLTAIDDSNSLLDMILGLLMVFLAFVSIVFFIIAMNARIHLADASIKYKRIIGAGEVAFESIKKIERVSYSMMIYDDSGKKHRVQFIAISHYLLFLEEVAKRVGLDRFHFLNDLEKKKYETLYGQSKNV